MVLRYLSPKEFVVDNALLRYGVHRSLVRDALEVGYKEENQIIPVGDSAQPLVQRRDIYGGPDLDKGYFFLNYDEDDLLIELEIHRCEEIQIFDFAFDFNDDINSIATELSKYSSVSKRSEGEYFFKDLNISIIDEMHMGGGEKSTLSYFYCAVDVNHLEG